MAVNNLSSYLENIVRIEITFKEIDDQKVLLCYNTFDTQKDYVINLQRLEIKAKNKIREDLADIEDKDSRQKYLLRIWRDMETKQNRLAEIRDILMSANILNYQELKKSEWFLLVQVNITCHFPDGDKRISLHEDYDFLPYSVSTYLIHWIQYSERSLDAVFTYLKSLAKIEWEVEEDKILEYEDLNIGLKSEPENKVDLQTIFNSNNNAFEVCKELLEDLELTINGKPNPENKKGRVGKLTGLISAIKETPGMLKLDKPKNLQLLQYFNSYLHTSYKTFSKRNEDYPSSLDTSKRYIKSNFKK